MSDLISRSALIAEYDRVHVGPPGGARKLMEDAPAVDAVPVVHGRWIKIGADEFVCSACGGYVEYESRKCGYEYCHHCGAKMDGGKDHATD